MPYPHQEQAITWMCSREGMPVSPKEELRFVNKTTSLHELFRHWPGDPSLLFSPTTLYFTREFQSAAASRRGGVLCDTMGLGKTFEIIALIILHPRPAGKPTSACEVINWNQAVETMLRVVRGRQVGKQLKRLFHKKSSDDGDEEGDDGIITAEKNRNLSMSASECVHPSFITDSSKLVKGSEVFCICDDFSLIGKRGHLLQCSVCHLFQHFCYSTENINSSSYICHYCMKRTARTSRRVYSKTTLVLVPAHICIQWIEELRKHLMPCEDTKQSDTHIIDGVYCEGIINKTRYLLYPGSTVIHNRIKAGHVNSRLPLLLHPEFLAQYDVILSRYESFVQDYTLFASEKPSLRSLPRYASFASPLFCVEWWRLVLDEVHLVENSPDTLLRCNLLYRVNVWCVSGTPFNQQMNELYYILSLVNVPQFSIRSVWEQNGLSLDREDVYTVLRDIIQEYFWRTSFEDLQQLSPGLIPPQQRHVQRITFSGIERTYYQRVQERCIKLLQPFMEKGIERYSSAFLQNPLDRKDINRVLQQLKPLRQACCHYQIGSDLSSGQHVLTMNEIQCKLRDNIIVDCETALRNLVASRNAVAGLSLLQNDVLTAAKSYKHTLSFCEECLTNGVKTDTLQLIHCCYNLLYCGDLDDSVLTVAEHISLSARQLQLETLYLEKAQSSLDDAVEARAKSEEVPTAAIKTVMEQTYEYLLSMTSTSLPEEKEEVISDINTYLFKRSYGNPSRNRDNQENSSISLLQTASVVSTCFTHLQIIVERSVYKGQLYIRSIDGLLLLLCHWTECLISLRDTITDQIDSFNGIPSDDLVIFLIISYKQIAECSQCYRCRELTGKDKTCPALKKQFLCSHCRFDQFIKLFDSLLYDFRYDETTVDNGLTTDEDRTKTARSLSPGVCVSLVLAIRRVMPDIADDNKEFSNKVIRKLLDRSLLYHTIWQAQHMHILGYEELWQCHSRIQLHEQYPFYDDMVCVVEKHDVDRLLKQQNMSCIEFQSKFDDTMALLRFIRSSSAHNSETTTITCPICMSQVDDKISMLSCGHSFCTECILIYVKFRREKNFSICCPLCARQFANSDINVVTVKRTEDPESMLWGRKIGAILTLIKSILSDVNTDEGNKKILIFSQWEDSLTILGSILRKSEIKYLIMKRDRNYESTIRFKNSSDIPVFLMLLQQGNNGLDMSIASHIIIFEPILSATMEAQAVSRVLRIGQCFPSHVYYVIVDNTIESRIYELFERRKLGSTQNQGYGRKEKEILTGSDLQELLKA